MTTRFPGLVPALAFQAFVLIAAGAAQAQQQPQFDTGNMAYPAPRASGEVQVRAPTARDTGNMALPASPGGVVERAPQGADTGNMALPTGRSSVATTNPPPTQTLRQAIAARRGTKVAAGDPANSMRPDVVPTPAQTATAQSLDSGPASAPVPYTDFLPPARTAAKGGHGPIHHAVVRGHKAAAKPAKPATPAAAPAAPAK